MTLRRLLRVAYALAASTMVFGAGCAVDARSDAFVCTEGNACPAGRQCVDGWCVTTDPSVDASGPEPPIDASGDPCDPPVCGDGLCCSGGVEDECSCSADCGTSCGDGCCTGAETPTSCEGDCVSCDSCVLDMCAESCGGADADCGLDCPSGCTCDFSCQSADQCQVECRGGSTCDVACQGAAQCEVRCDGNSTCEVDCRNADTCDGIECLPGASCLVQCAGADSCAFDRCNGGATSCAGDVIVCNRPCPN